MQALGDDDKANIHQTIDDEVLKRRDIMFRSTRRERAADGSRIERRGRPDARRRDPPIAFDLAIAGDGTLSATAVVTQSRWGMKPYSALFGALKVADDVEVVLDAPPVAVSRDRRSARRARPRRPAAARRCRARRGRCPRSS